MKTRLVGLMVALSAVLGQAALAESYTCKNVEGWGTWKYTILSTMTGPGKLEKEFVVTYSGYSKVERRFGDWGGSGWWIVSLSDPAGGESESFLVMENGGDTYHQTCFQQTLTRWTCSDNYGFNYDLECSIF